MKIAIIDCNNFYVSCERIFNPESVGKPTVVLSNNDGCVIARSQEAKNLKIKMGEPFFLKREFMEQHNFHVYSSNYNLYGDMSDRVMTTIKQYADKVEVYSIDECFVDFTDIPDDKLIPHITMIRAEVLRQTGIPVSIGIAPNKTLAKLSSAIVKKQPGYQGIGSYWHIDRDKLLSFPIDDLWGIGRKWGEKLNTLGINNIDKFIRINDNAIKKLLNVNGLRLKMELNEFYCFPINLIPKQKRTIASTRSFGEDINSFEQIAEAMYQYIEWGIKKLKDNKMSPTDAIIFLQGNIHKENYTHNSKYIPLNNNNKTADDIWNQIHPHLLNLYNEDKSYKKCGIIFNRLLPDNIEQKKLFEDIIHKVNHPINSEKKWEMRNQYLTRKYTTDWNDIPVIK